MGDVNVDAYKKLVAKVVDAWGRDVEKIAKQLEELAKQREAVKKQMESLPDGLQEDLLKIDAPQADERELDKVVVWLEGIVKKKLASLSKVMLTDAEAKWDDRLEKPLVSMRWSWDS
jgi:hypothetical protein